MSGLEVAGLAIGTFALAIQGVERYSDVVPGREIKLLTESLRNTQQIFKNSVEHLLRLTVSANELSELLGNWQHPLWSDEALSRRVTDHLGCEATNVFELIHDINNTIVKLRQKLPKAHGDDTTTVKRAAHVIKCFVRGPHYKSSLEKLKKRIDEFVDVTRGALKLILIRKGEKALQDSRRLDLVYECASELYEAFEAAWQCDCDQAHPANLQLDVWSLPTPNEGDAVRPKFSFLFADDAQQAQQDHWMTAEMSPPRSSPFSSESPMAGALPFRSVSTPSNITAVTQTSSPSGSSLTNSTASSTSQAGPINGTINLCPVIKKPDMALRTTRRKLGSISSQNCPNIDLFSMHSTMATKTSVKLADFMSERRMSSNKTRVQLGLMLAWGVFQISRTNWLRGNWTKENILVVLDAPNKPTPYISHRFQSSRKLSRQPTLSPTTRDNIAKWVSNMSFFALGVCLLEMCFNQSIEDLATQNEKNDQGSPTDHTPFLTAMRVENLVQDELGVDYAQAVRQCLHFPRLKLDGRGRPKDSVQFTKKVMEEIILPLETLAKTYG